MKTANSPQDQTRAWGDRTDSGDNTQNAGDLLSVHWNTCHEGHTCQGKAKFHRPQVTVGFTFDDAGQFMCEEDEKMNDSKVKELGIIPAVRRSTGSYILSCSRLRIEPDSFGYWPTGSFGILEPQIDSCGYCNL